MLRDRYDHMPYLPFPPSWPVSSLGIKCVTNAKRVEVFTPKDKLADWFEYYAGILKLNVWTNSTLRETQWDDHTRQWTVKVTRKRDGILEDRMRSPLSLRPRKLFNSLPHRYAQPSTHYSCHRARRRAINFGSFQGDRVIHSSQFTEPRGDGKGKKAVMVESRLL